MEEAQGEKPYVCYGLAREAISVWSRKNKDQLVFINYCCFTLQRSEGESEARSEEDRFEAI